jgi:hypothetical protein
MIASASSMATDDEVAAEIQYQLCNFKTVAEKYPNTHKGELVRGKCDKLYDYHAGTKIKNLSAVEKNVEEYKNNIIWY